ncbi:MAG: glycosyltransferase family 1 protein [Thermoplasmatales archaeon]
MYEKNNMLILLNQYPPPSGVYRYAKDIRNSVEGSVLYTFLYGPSKYTMPSYSQEQYVQGKFKGVKVLNKLFPNFSHQSFIKNLNELAGAESILHYASPMIPLRVSSISHVVTIHDPPSYLLNTDLFSNNSSIVPIMNLLQKKFQSHYLESFKEFSNVIADSNYVRSIILEEGFTENTKVIYPCIPPSFKLLPEKKMLKEKLGLPLDKICVLSVSTMLKRKNLSMVKKTMELLGDYFKLVRVGAPITPDNLSFENISYDKLNMIYNACDVMLFPSLYEGFGYPLVEAFATGLPVVASDIEIFREISGNKAALLADPNDPKCLASSIKEAVNSSSSLAEKGLERSKRFSFENFRSEINNYYRRIIC